MNLGLLKANIDVGNNRLERAVAQAVGNTVAGGNQAASNEVARQLRDQQVTINQSGLEATITSYGAQVGQLLQKVHHVQSHTGSYTSSTHKDIKELEAAIQKVRNDFYSHDVMVSIDEELKDPNISVVDRGYFTDLKSKVDNMYKEMDKAVDILQNAKNKFAGDKAAISSLESSLAKMKSDFEAEKQNGLKLVADLRAVRSQHANNPTPSNSKE